MCPKYPLEMEEIETGTGEADAMDAEALADAEWDCHPVLESMRDAGCNDEKKIAVAFSVYLGLCEVEKLSDLRWEFNKTHEYFYMTGKTSMSSSNVEVFVPVSVNCEITPQWLEHVQNDVHHETGIKRFRLAIKDEDSTVVYYAVSQGLFSPDSPETARKKKKSRETHNAIASELQKQRQEIYESALSKVQNDDI